MVSHVERMDDKLVKRVCRSKCIGNRPTEKAKKEWMKSIKVSEENKCEFSIRKGIGE